MLIHIAKIFCEQQIVRFCSILDHLQYAVMVSATELCLHVLLSRRFIVFDGCWDAG